mmetsp:Transcript_7940/g.17031  ORF Transcript_7940/g.17031 Transcript_7940/m.17031 type:complete len:622 (-) Transcript_7940:550-2415(-)|eukprot:CAMPEP_0185847128 /NCGR_PEP_ID=MMETSP1354-20130828/2514_1 /TAXON_ID=708628 /ORGANISM="Erythrolobus madagascarensis, Strain CCMP3276" /LENGTH=621 /DNA_ID=CAMNT_0028547379 /DNA_START=300 /DNA_END=2165 /DNA_ORIENTATION=+
MICEDGERNSRRERAAAAAVAFGLSGVSPIRRAGHNSSQGVSSKSCAAASQETRAARLSGRRKLRMAGAEREPWPLQRFVKDALFFTPLGKALRWREDLQISAPEPAAAAASIARSKGSILVTGATGGTGKRVVKLLLERGYRVHALVRDEERAKAVLGAIGVDADSEPNLVLCAGDLHNVHADFIAGVRTIISCTGVKVGPEDDTPDRSKYYQGVVFYPPKILEDTPHNVEHVGIANLVSQAELNLVQNDQQNQQQQQLVSAPLMRFDDTETRRSWGVIDDVVMGGVSESSLRATAADDGGALFSGTVSTSNRGGFASVRSASLAEPVDVSGGGAFDAFRIRVRGDGQRYKFIARCDQKWDSVAFCYSFDTQRAQWSDVVIPFDQLKPVFRASTLQDGTKFQPSTVFSFQLMLSKFEYDGELNPSFSAGPFALEIKSIDVVSTVPQSPSSSPSSNARSAPPRIIHVSSAGVTRVLRRDEFPDWDAQPPAVRMNDMLGRILEWKLAGEDVIRASDLPHLIVRPCALTEDEPTGYNALRVDQGDNITGKISRNDLATVLVDAVECSALVNTTIELKSVEPREQQQQHDAADSLAELARNLSKAGSKQEERHHEFAKFPYEPV